MTTTNSQGKHIQVSTRPRGSQGDRVFALSLDQETVTLDPGLTWAQVDHHKWVMRGLIEEPQMLHVFPDGSVEINSERIGMADPEAATKLEQQINKHHPPGSAHPPAAVAPSPAKPATTPAADRRRFRVKLDHFGHLMIGWGQGVEREETGLRGLAALITNGLMRKPGHYRVDPMQRSVEIDGVTYECNEAGAQKLEAALNTHYAPETLGIQTGGIEIKSNLAASTGFDIHFRTTHAGVTHEIKEHLTQEVLDLLQNPEKCELIQPGIHLLLSPPNLLIRKRRPDMGEEKIPELPDVNLLRVTPVQLQQLFNHPLIRRSTGDPAAGSSPSGSAPREAIVELRVVRKPEEKSFLWLEGVTAHGRTVESRAFTHHNIADLQLAGCFQQHLEVCLSLDHQRLSVHDGPTNRAETVTLDVRNCSDADLREASGMLTRALKPAELSPAGGLEPVAVAATSPGPPPADTAATTEPAPAQPPSSASSAPSSPPPPPPDPAIVALFRETDSLRIHQEIFRRLCVHLGITPQEVFLSLPFVFDNRRFEILNFERQEIVNVMELHGTDFYGFYLSHVSEKRLLLVYACNGMHIEWGPDKCVLRPTVQSKSESYPGGVLLGLAQNRSNEFVFIVRPEFKTWIAPRETPYTEENLQLLTVADIAVAPENFTLIWPPRPG